MYTSFTIEGNTVSKSNSYKISRNRIYKTADVINYERYVTAKASDVKDEAWPMDDAYSLELYVYWSDNKRRDIDNIIKSIMDGMKNVLYDDDSQVHELHVYRLIDHAYPRVEVHLQTMNG